MLQNISQNFHKKYTKLHAINTYHMLCSVSRGVICGEGVGNTILQQARNEEIIKLQISLITDILNNTE
jgi:hypothetical protein